MVRRSFVRKERAAPPDAFAADEPRALESIGLAREPAIVELELAGNVCDASRADPTWRYTRSKQTALAVGAEDRKELWSSGSAS